MSQQPSGPHSIDQMEPVLILSHSYTYYAPREILAVRLVQPMAITLGADPSVYFVHSYYVAPKDSQLVATETDYETPFTSAIWHENVFATQFHPEKSQRVGLAMLKNFAAMT